VYQTSGDYLSTPRKKYPWGSKVASCDCPHSKLIKSTWISLDEEVQTMHGNKFLHSQRILAGTVTTELSEVYLEQAFQLQAEEQCQLHFANRTRDPDDEPRSGWPGKTDFAGPITQLLSDKPFIECFRAV
jgi:hypothetical protein